MSRTAWIRVAWLVPIALLTVVASSCGGDDGAAADESTVEVALNDFDLKLSPETMASGEVTFRATNAGPSTHEFEVFSGADEVDITALPVEDDVADTTGLTLIDEIEDVTPGSEAELPISLDPGTYAIICNLPEHYAEGMYSTLTVE